MSREAFEYLLLLFIILSLTIQANICVGFYLSFHRKASRADITTGSAIALMLFMYIFFPLFACLFGGHMFEASFGFSETNKHKWCMYVQVE